MVCIIVCFSTYYFPQQKTATYSDLSPNFFLSYKQPIGIAILKFEGSSDLHKNLYDELKVQPVIHSKFTIFPYDILEQQKGLLGIKGEISLDNLKALKLLKDKLEIELIVSGNYMNRNDFLLTIYRTSDGQKVFENIYESSTNSTGMKDAIKLFSENQRTLYEGGPKAPEGMVFVEGGYFEMGSENGEIDEKPVHSIFVSSFYIDKYEVTQREYERVMGSNPSYFKCPDCPVVGVNWNEANEYAIKIGKRLLTEAEWEYAARGGNKSNNYIYSGSNNLDKIGWYPKNSGGEIHKVGQKRPNELGIYDMSGNVWEWCSDWYDENYYSKSPIRNPKGPGKSSDCCNSKVHRGGACGDFVVPSKNKYEIRVTDRSCTTFDQRAYNLGFRCAQDY